MIENPIWEYFLKEENGSKAKCTICPNSIVGLNFGTSSMRIHMKKKHQINVKTNRKDMSNDLICGICGYKTNKSSNMKMHNDAVHLKIKNFACEQCSFRSFSQNYLQRHMKNVHEKVKDLACMKCPFKTAYAQHLRKHIRDNHETEPKINTKMQKRIEISKMMAEGVEWHVIRDKMKCSKQLLYKIRGPTYKSKVSRVTVKHRRSKVKPSPLVTWDTNDEEDVEIKEDSLNREVTAEEFKPLIKDDDYDYNQGNENENSVTGKKCPMCEYVIEDEKSFTKHMISLHVL